MNDDVMIKFLPNLSELDKLTNLNIGSIIFMNSFFYIHYIGNICTSKIIKPLADVLLELKHMQYLNISHISLKDLIEKDWLDLNYNIPNLRELNISNTQLSKAHYYLIFKYIPTLPLFSRLIMNNVGDICQRESYYIGQGLAKTKSLRDLQMQSIIN